MIKTKKVKKFGIGKFLVMALVLGGGLVYGTQMAQKSQENRSSAAGTQALPCRCSKSVYKTQSLCAKAKGTWICPKITTKPTVTPTPISQKTCITGQKICKGNVSMICKNNTWVIFKTCGDGCGNGECIPKVTTPTQNGSGGRQDQCDGAETTCKEGYVYKCSNHMFVKTNTNCGTGYSSGPCTSVIYTTWSPCKDGKQTRSIWEKNPSGCTVENPILSQSCSN